MMTREQLELAYAHAEQARVVAERAYAATARLAPQFEAARRFVEEELQKYRSTVRYQNKCNDRNVAFIEKVRACGLSNCNGQLFLHANEELLAKGMKVTSIQCGACGKTLAPPPVTYLKLAADDFYRSVRQMMNARDRVNANVVVFNACHSVELYLKSLGAYENWVDDDDDDEEEMPDGPGLLHKKHDLRELLNRASPYVIDRLKRAKVGDLKLVEAINRIPSQTNECFRYAGLINGEYPPCSTDEAGHVWIDRGKDRMNLTRLLVELCETLRAFCAAERVL